VKKPPALVIPKPINLPSRRKLQCVRGFNCASHSEGKSLQIVRLKFGVAADAAAAATAIVLACDLFS